jgi:hypothetical protein
LRRFGLGGDSSGGWCLNFVSSRRAGFSDRHRRDGAATFFGALLGSGCHSFQPRNLLFKSFTSYWSGIDNTRIGGPSI